MPWGGFLEILRRNLALPLEHFPGGASAHARADVPFVNRAYSPGMRLALSSHLGPDGSLALLRLMQMQTNRSGDSPGTATRNVLDSLDRFVAAHAQR